MPTYQTIMISYSEWANITLHHIIRFVNPDFDRRDNGDREVTLFMTFRNDSNLSSTLAYGKIIIMDSTDNVSTD